jgi:hypothetical protein
MLAKYELESLSDKMHVYDVDQGGWEQEANSIQANARHVLFHLTKDLVYKDFLDPVIVQTAIAPDSVQYALRLGRWVGLNPERLHVSRSEILIAEELDPGSDQSPLHLTAFKEAVGILAGNLHDLDHKKTQADALRHQPDLFRQAGRMLIYSASIQSAEYDFNLVETFDDRLSGLRRRFNIPEPSEAHKVNLEN